MHVSMLTNVPEMSGFIEIFYMYSLLTPVSCRELWLGNDNSLELCYRDVCKMFRYSVTFRGKVR